MHVQLTTTLWNCFEPSVQEALLSGCDSKTRVALLSKGKLPTPGGNGPSKDRNVTIIQLPIAEIEKAIETRLPVLKNWLRELEGAIPEQDNSYSDFSMAFAELRRIYRDQYPPSQLLTMPVPDEIAYEHGLALIEALQRHLKAHERLDLDGIFLPKEKLHWIRRACEGLDGIALRLTSAGMDNEGLKVLADTELLERVETLDLSSNIFTGEGLKALAQAIEGIELFTGMELTLDGSRMSEDDFAHFKPVLLKHAITVNLPGLNPQFLDGLEKDDFAILNVE